MYICIFFVQVAKIYFWYVPPKPFEPSNDIPVKWEPFSDGDYINMVDPVNPCP